MSVCVFLPCQLFDVRDVRASSAVSKRWLLSAEQQYVALVEAKHAGNITKKLFSGNEISS